MADTKVADAYVEIGAKMDKLERDLKKAEKKVEDGFARAGKKAGNALESPIVAAALKATASFGALELGVGGVNVAVSAFTGDIEGAADAIKRLPAGIGPFASQLDTLLGTVTGIRAEIEKTERATRSLQVASEIRMKAADAALEGRRKGAQTILDIEREIALMQASPRDRARMAIDIGGEKQIEAARAEQDRLKKSARSIAIANAGNKEQIKAREDIKALDQDILGLQEKIDTITNDGFKKYRRRLEDKQRGLVAERNVLGAVDEAVKNEVQGLYDQAAAQEKIIQKIRERTKVEQDAAAQARMANLESENAASLAGASAQVEALTAEADVAVITDPFARDRKIADQRLAEHEKRAMEIQQVDQQLAEEFRKQSENIHQSEIAEIKRREQEKAQAEEDIKMREMDRIQQDEMRAIEVNFRDRSRAEQKLQREQERAQREATSRQEKVDSTSAVVRSVSSRLLRPGDAGFGGTAGTAENLRPQKIESKTLDDIKALMERSLIQGGGFA